MYVYKWDERWINAAVRGKATRDEQTDKSNFRYNSR
jgi:hypothetical protein